ncbi:regulator of G-protein signaling 9-binding protein-like [Biomphalaria glabrata]|uniref:Regulator of G-protein signaling 9-binding protein-like n=1 Tax=Biomphalaria glabrata TaxID=6526 RepID=A0A9W2Z0Z3_BIOGL|nr:regulator of G-protein signaling 9-binding protein-like [Biomphalaria glabrata]XP_055868705.1 regulator of G-protein signaling 9-binding protein-like [Biomphalaria glabrata]XP_055868716.1 regulator of G-protein signaling 9-binding protein-like [Biomphalaria glabrata]XP_055868722.1 regulator of G-protein signaling 9-binding protein-like [Biomphalaria glabrata]XP_055868732.1 regulator of G-protein signaling 9-binding protein-like [Biomphalaria glabrata]XP_055868736.1 regulator of G-protein si
MVPSDHTETIEHHPHTTTFSGGNQNSHSTGGHAGSTTGQRHQDGSENDPKGPATKQECTKLVNSLSKEVAVYCFMSMGLGAVCDSYALRDELKCLGVKVFDLVQLCKRRLMPLLLSKRSKEEEREDLERLYRIFVACLEMLQAEFVRSMMLQSVFPLWDSNTALIQTGVSECYVHKKCASATDSHEHAIPDRKMADQEEFTTLERKVATLQEMCYATSQMMDVNPWDYKPDTDHTKIDLETSDPEQDVPSRSETHVNTRSPRHRKCIWITVLVFGTVIVIAGVLGLALALTKNEATQN